MSKRYVSARTLRLKVKVVGINSVFAALLNTRCSLARAELKTGKPSDADCQSAQSSEMNNEVGNSDSATVFEADVCLTLGF
jgi:hypothetical protein